MFKVEASEERFRRDFPLSGALESVSPQARDTFLQLPTPASRSYHNRIFGRCARGAKLLWRLGIPPPRMVNEAASPGSGFDKLA